MAVLFLLLAFLVLVVLAVAGVENSDPSTLTLFDRSFGQLSEGQLLVLAAGLGFLVALFLFLAYGASRTRRSRRKELKSRRRDAEGRVDELERENSRLQTDLAGAREELESVQRGRADAVAERDRAEATVDRVRAGATAGRDPAGTAAAASDSAGATAVDDRGKVTPARQEHVRAADEHARAADQHTRAAEEADDQARRR